MDGAEILVACLEREGVDTIFAYPGGASMPIHQALTKSTKIRTVLPRHEQGGVFAAEGYARATGRAGVCMATSGPGATNLLSGIADAYMDSIPLVAITGQVPQWMIGRGAFQETDVFGMTLPVVKHSYLVWDINDIPRVVKEAFHIAQSGRPGPVLIDVPKNIQQQKAQPIFPTKVSLRGYDEDGPAADEVALNEVIGLIGGAQAPDALRRWRNHFFGRSGRTDGIRRADADPRGDDAHGHRLLPGNAPAFAQMAGDARHGVRQQRRQRGRRAACHGRAVSTTA